MQITAIHAQQPGPTAGELQAGDVFIRNARHGRPLRDRKSYIVLWPHTRFADIRQYASTSKEIICVSLHNGRLVSFDADQPVLQLEADNLELSISGA